MSATLLHVGDHDWTAEDGYVVHFRLRNGCTGIMQSVASDRGPMLFATRVAGTKGAVWAEGDRVQVTDASGTRELPIPDAIAVAPPDPPPMDLMHTTYDLLHSTGIDMGPYTRLCETFLALIEGRAIPQNPQPATFADGVKSMEVLDAIRASAANGGAYVELP